MADNFTFIYDKWRKETEYKEYSLKMFFNEFNLYFSREPVFSYKALVNKMKKKLKL